jgi:hypothetical protein
MSKDEGRASSRSAGNHHKADSLALEEQEAKMPKDNLRDRSKVKPQGEDAAFLVEEFEVPPHEAADLVTREGGDAGKVEDETREAIKKRDPLKEKPTPKPPASDFTADADEERLKPVVREDNRRTSGG